MLQPKHEAILSRARPPTPTLGWGEHPPPSRSTIPPGCARVCADFAPTPSLRRARGHPKTTRAASRPPSLRLLVGPEPSCARGPAHGRRRHRRGRHDRRADRRRAAGAPPRLARRGVLRPLDQLLGPDRVAVLVLRDQLEADPAARLVDLLHDDVERCRRALMTSSMWPTRPGPDVRDVEQAVRALLQLDERAELGRLDDLAACNVSPTSGSLVSASIAAIAGVGLLAVGRVDEDRAVLLDVDLHLELGSRPRIVSPPLPMTRPIFSGSILIDVDPRRVLGELARAARRSPRPSCRG